VNQHWTHRFVPLQPEVALPMRRRAAILAFKLRRHRKASEQHFASLRHLTARSLAWEVAMMQREVRQAAAAPTMDLFGEAA